jgi:hypothetical protein
LESLDGVGELSEAGFDCGEAEVEIGCWCGQRGWGRFGYGGRERATEEVGVAVLAGAGLAGEHDGERPGGGGVGGAGSGVGGGAGGEAVEGGEDGVDAVEGVEAVGAAAEFAGGLGAAEDEEAEDGDLVAAEVEDGAEAVLVLGDAGVADRGDDVEVFEGVEGLADLVLGEIEDGIAAGALVAGGDEGVE